MWLFFDMVVVVVVVARVRRRIARVIVRVVFYVDVRWLCSLLLCVRRQHH